ncbi:hypothetical protein BDQ17DRAFT_687738 [Cyathus striatus]|nr:hypothetical protein BDQ17DRAFT_687738 [Cyathus striatus]
MLIFTLAVLPLAFPACLLLVPSRKWLCWLFAIVIWRFRSSRYSYLRIHRRCTFAAPPGDVIGRKNPVYPKPHFAGVLLHD